MIYALWCLISILIYLIICVTPPNIKTFSGNSFIQFGSGSINTVRKEDKLGEKEKKRIYGMSHKLTINFTFQSPDSGISLKILPNHFGKQFEVELHFVLHGQIEAGKFTWKRMFAFQILLSNWFARSYFVDPFVSSEPKFVDNVHYKWYVMHLW